jgi:ribonuclease G
MPKELIVSVNGREKKIAIVDNGKITEFYIERGEDGQGIVGNIYKGRVMRVLPGMQSAFVDIGLERDAFLYVSDFFDEEEEFERIVVDKSKTEGAEAARAHAAEKIERDRIERERQIESAQERVEPTAAAVDDETEEEAGAEELPAAPEIAAAQSVVAPAETETEASEAAGGRRSRRRRGKGGRTEEQAQAATVGGGARAPQAPRAGGRLEADTPFAQAAGSFERVVDEEAFGEGEMFKDARLQERITDQIRGVEFDLAEPTQGVEVGSVLAANNLSGGGSFERVADEEFDYDAAPREVKRVQPAVAASVAALSESVLDEAPGTTGAPRAFERVSDDEKAVEALPATKGKGARARSGAKSKATTEAAAAKSKRAPKGATKSAAKKAAPATKSATKASSKGRATKRGKATADETGVDGASLTDADASVKATRTRGEFARRGGRRRNRRPTAGENGGAEEQGNGHAEPAEPVVETAPAPVPEAAAPERVERVERTAHTERPARPERAERTERSPRGGGRDRRTDGGRPSGGRSNTGGHSNEGRGESSGREGSSREGGGRESGGRESGGRAHGGRGERGRGGRDRGTPMITDLLREGQEILVQIAKEPIAQKGARITSHIALPGRFLVYMPTIEHVGVSRKIESDGERQRLRKLIKDIRETEEVPSGGFIVRTAGIGISEQDLRDDARYLVRTWKDIKRNAEKQKAPALAHKDLDLVQRILRDQLSDDFTAIRVDGEEEYREIVEFINRIQPRLVNRVKLYTREEPILEAYGVQAEIDKAIKPRVWLKSGGYLVINQTEALVAIDVNTGKFVGRGGTRLEDTITRTNLEAVDEIARQIRLRDLGGIIVLDLIDMEERRNRARVMQALQDALRDDKSPTKVLSFNDFGLVIMTRKRVKQSLERTLCSPCPYCTGAGLVKSPQTVCYEILEEARRLSRSLNGEGIKQTTLRINPEVARALRSTERDVLTEIEDYLGAVDITSDAHVHQEQFDFAFV